MFIAPIKRIDGISQLSQIKGIGAEISAGDSSGAIFKNIFSDAVKNVIETDNQVAADVQALATGETDDLHNLGVDQTKAQLSIELMVQLRNRLLEAYNEIMRINI